MDSLRSQRGDIPILLALVGLGILALVALSVSSGVKDARAAAMKRQRTVLANAYASELLEVLRSFRMGRLEGYLRVNPATASAVPADLYSYCAHINILDRGNGAILNRDPIADLPPTNGLSNANRYYRVQIVDLATGNIDTSTCNKTAAQAIASGNQAYLVTVGVSWMEPDEADPKRVVLSTVVGATQ